MGRAVVKSRREWWRALKLVVDRLLTCIGVLIYLTGLFGWVIRLNRHAPKVLMYHACEPAENDFIRGLSINTTPGQLSAHLSYLTRYYKVITLDQLLEEPPTEGAVALTFDDGFRSVYENAWPRLRERRLSATCYLATSVIGNQALIWLNELNWLLRNHSPVARPAVAQRLCLKPAASLAQMLRSMVDNFASMKVDEMLTYLRARIGTDERALAQTHRLHLEWDQINEMSAAGITFGNHTCDHRPLGQLELDAAREEIRGALPALEHLAGATQSLAYPFGSRREDTRRLALELGVRKILEVEGVNSPLDPSRIGRIQVGDDSVPVLFARMEIVEPVKWWLKRWIRRAGFLGRDDWR
jgi:peptidoglycan/xylan/chitin deacetylase (PgdA/CDA1 family)